MAGLSLITSILTLNDPKTSEIMRRWISIPLSIQYILMFIGITVQLISGVGILKGMNWARFLYVIFSIVGFVIGIFISPFKIFIVTSIVVFIIVVFYLFRPSANDYFAGREDNRSVEIEVTASIAEGPKGARKVISIICYVISGYFLYMMCFLAFVNKPWIFIKFAIVGGFGIVALLFLTIGLGFVRFYNWKRNVGIVFLSAAGFALFVTLSLGWVMREPEFIKELPAGAMNLFGDYVSVSICTAFLGAAGLMLIKISKVNSSK
jgi:hypothetical protein